MDGPRSATEDDVEGILALLAERSGPEWVPHVQSLLDDPDIGPSRFTVVTDGGRVVSSLCLLASRLRMNGVDIPVGQPEFVNTAATHGHRGLVRGQMDLVHRWSAERGDLAQIVAGIPYFYRRFGYEYALDYGRVRLARPGVELPMPDGWTVRRAAPDDAPAIVALQERAQAHADLAGVRGERWWRRWVQVDSRTPTLVAEHDGRVGGVAVVGPGDPLGERATGVSAVAHDHVDGLRALLAEAATAGRPVAVEERGRHTGPVHPMSERLAMRYALYVRVADPVALLDHLRPVLSARLAASPRAAESGRLLLSTYTSSMTIVYERGDVVAVEPGPPVQDPDEQGGAGVPPDLVATFIFGRHGAAGLAERHDDVWLGPAADLVDTLFPRLVADTSLVQ